MMNWHKYPFLRLLLPLALGIGLSEAFSALQLNLFVAYVALWITSSLFLLLHCLVKSFRYRWLIGLDMMIVFALVGFLLARLQEPKPIRKEEGMYLARVYDLPVEKEKTVKVLLELVGFHADSATTPCSGRMIAYVEKTEEALALHYGSVIAFATQVEPISPPQNPNEFDYRTYLRRRGVTGRSYLKQNEWISMEMDMGNSLFSFAYRFRDLLLHALSDCGVAGDEFGTAAAILLGYDESLPAQLRHHYVAAGSMHILCVSGMHVGIIYLLASFVLGFLGKGRKMAMVRRVLLLALIWFYALITGLSPSILRSALMISMVIMGELTHRKGVVLNSIAASAFIILLVHPCDLFSIGFQLSYAAVVGIVVLQRPIYLLLYMRNKLLDKVWEITAVSIAAQVATMPFTVYYFNQLTPYFWLSNLMMTPLSFLVILLGMLLLLVSWVPGLRLLMGKMVWACLRLMNVTVAGIDQLPFSLIKGVYLDGTEFAFALVLLLLLYLIINIKKKRFLMEMLVVSALLAGSMAVRSQRSSVQTQLVAYSMKNHTAFDFICGPKHLLLCDEGLLSDDSSIDYSLRGAWSSQQLLMNPCCYTLADDVTTDLMQKQGPLVSFQGLLLAFVEPGSDIEPLEQAVDVDYLIVTGKQRPELSRLMEVYKPLMLIVDGTVPSYYVDAWRRQSAAIGLPCQCLEDGYFVHDLSRN